MSRGCWQHGTHATPATGTPTFLIFKYFCAAPSAKTSADTFATNSLRCCVAHSLLPTAAAPLPPPPPPPLPPPSPAPASVGDAPLRLERNTGNSVNRWSFRKSEANREKTSEEAPLQHCTLIYGATAALTFGSPQVLRHLLHCGPILSHFLLHGLQR